MNINPSNSVVVPAAPVSLQLGQSGNNANNVRRAEPVQPLTAEQKSKVNDILSNYDAKDMSAKDVKEIKDALKNQDIRPSEDLAKQVEERGFNSSQIVPKDPQKGVGAVSQGVAAGMYESSAMSNSDMTPSAVASSTVSSDDDSLSSKVLSEIKNSTEVEVPPSLEFLIQELRTKEGSSMSGNLVDVLS